LKTWVTPLTVKARCVLAFVNSQGDVLRVSVASTARIAALTGRRRVRPFLVSQKTISVSVTPPI
jgi:hypothetical protein